MIRDLYLAAVIYGLPLAVALTTALHAINPRKGRTT